MWLNLETELINNAIAALVQAGHQTQADELQRRKDEGDTSDDMSQKYLAAARTHYASDGDLEFDGSAVVSMGDDPGAYVMGWKWITNELAGIEDEDAGEDDEDEEEAA